MPLKELISTIAQALVDDPDSVEVREIEGDQNSLIELRVAKGDIGKVIGKEGRTAQIDAHHPHGRINEARAPRAPGHRGLDAAAGIAVSPMASTGPGEPLRIGRVARAHGLKGELEVRLDWPDSQSLSQAERVVLQLPDGATRSCAVAGTRKTHKGLLLRLDGVVDRTAAEALCGATLSVLRSELPPLEDGEYYLCDLVGLEVSGPAGRLGQVLEVQMYPSVDAIVIEGPGGERFEQPLLAEWLERVDVRAGTIVLRSLDGLLEEPSPSSEAAVGVEPTGSGES